MRSLTMAGVAMLVLVGGRAWAEEQETAEELFGRGGQLFLEDRHQEALEAYQRSYQLNPVNVVLYNIALCQRSLGQLAEAIETFERYLDGDREISEARQQEVRALIEEMRPQVRQEPAEGPGSPQAGEGAQEAPRLVVETTSPPADEPRIPEDQHPAAGRRGQALRLAAYVTGAVGVAVLGTTLGLFVWNNGREDDWEAADALLRDRWPLASDQRELDQLERTYSTNLALGQELRSWGAAEWALLGVGLASLGAATALLVLGLRAGRQTRVSVSPGAGWLTVAMTWGGAATLPQP